MVAVFLGPTSAGRQRLRRKCKRSKVATHFSLVSESGWSLPLTFSRQAWSFRSAQVLAHEARPRIGRPRQQGQAGGIGYMACESMARNCSEKNLNSGKIAATLSRAGQIIQRKSIDQREQIQTIEETISNHGEHGEGEHTRCSQGGRGNHAWGQTGSGDCDTGHPPACGESGLMAIPAGLSKGASQRRTGKLSGASSQARRTLPATS